MQRHILSVIIALLIMMPVSYVSAQQNGNGKDPALTELERKVADLESKLQQVDRHTSDTREKTRDYAPIGLVLFLFGGFCALWAQNTGRSSWVWFFSGLFLSAFAVIWLLITNANDKRLN